MFTVYEVFKKDGAKFWRFEHKDRFDCECWIENHAYAERSYLLGLADFIIEEDDR